MFSSDVFYFFTQFNGFVSNIPELINIFLQNRFFGVLSVLLIFVFVIKALKYMLSLKV